ncbi:MAG TPA: M56 family metallopeptidase, partial [Pseudomonadales bacterium]
MDIALHTLQNVSAFIAVASLKGSVLIVLVLATQKLLGKLLPANWRYMLWFTAVFGLVTPVGYEATLPPEIRNPDFATFANVPLTESTRESAPEKPAGSAPPSPSPGRVPMVPDAGSETLVPAPLPVQNLTSLLSILWLAGVVAVIIAIAREGHRFAALVRRACPASAGAHAILRECSYLTGCRRSIALLESEEVGAPMISGQLTPTLLLPAGLPGVLTTAQLRHVFIHELMHLQRGDIAGNWIVAAVQALHWFNPLVWLAFSRMRLDRELACDAATLRYLAPAEAADYGRTLLQLNEAVPRARAPAIALGMVHGSADLHRRIVMLGRPSSRSRHAAAGTLVMLSLAALAFGQPVTGPRGPVMAPEVYAPVAAERPGQVTAFTDDESEAGAVTPAPQPVPVTAQAVIVEETISDTLNPPVPERVQATPVSSAASTGAESRGSEAVEQRAPARVEYPAASPSTPAIAPTTLLAAASTTSGTLTQAEPPPIAPYEGLVELERLADSLQAMKADKLAFIEKWNEIGSKCA